MISVLIPAYNNDATLLRLLQSIKAQTIADKLEIHISDDNSPIALGQTEAFFELTNILSIRWYRQTSNLGVLGNPRFLATKATTKYAVFAQHDDYYTDTTFFERAAQALSANPDVGIIFGNSNFEGSERSLMGKAESGFKLINGMEFTKRLWRDLMTSWSSIVFDLHEIKRHGGFGHTYTLTQVEGEDFSAYTQEEGMGFLYLICIRKDCLLEYKTVSTRGLPADAFSASPNNPAKYLANDCLFFIYWKVANICQQCGVRGELIARQVRDIAIFKFGLAQSNTRIMEFLGNSPKASLTVFLATTSYNKNRILYKITAPWRKAKNKLLQYILHLIR